MDKLPLYPIPEEIWEAIESNTRFRHDKTIRTSVDKYHKSYNGMIHFEEAFRTKVATSFDIDNVFLHKTKDVDIFYFLNDVTAFLNCQKMMQRKLSKTILSAICRIE